jgi:hypothetical protein
MFVEFAPFILSRVLNIFGEPLVELVMRVKQAWHDEV